MTTLDEAALLRAICESPLDDLPRYALADWHEEQGEAERAEFLRVQMEAARIVQRQTEWSYGLSYRLDDLRRRERELLYSNAANWWTWLADFYRITRRSAIGLIGHCSDPVDFAVGWRRGLVAEVVCKCAEWMAHGESIVLAAPIEKVTLSDREPQDYHNNSPQINEGHLYGWHRGLHEMDSHVGYSLPVELWDVVAEDRECVVHGAWADFFSPKLASDALSRAAILWARKKAGLPA